MTNYSELEIIEVLQNEGLEVSQVETKYFQKRGIIQSGDPLKSFMKTIEQVFESVEVSGRGKKRIYTVGAKHSEVQKRIDGNATNGRKISEAQIEFHDNAMGLIITQDLINKPYTLSTWARHFGIELKPVSEHDVNFQKLVRNLEQGFQMKHTDDVITKEEFTNQMPRFQWFRTIDITKNFVERFNGRAKGMTQSVFKIAQENGYIKTEMEYTGVINENKNEYKVITEEEYEKFKKRETEVLLEHGFDKKGKFISKSMEWVRYISQNEKLITDEWQVFGRVYQAVQELFREEFGYTRVFESIKITEVSEHAHTEFKYGDTGNGYAILADDMIADMHKRHFESDSKSAQNLHKQSDFKKRFPYLVATVLLGATDKQHMDNFKNDLKGFIANFEQYLIDTEVKKGLFITKEEIDLRKERAIESAMGKIKMYQFINKQDEIEKRSAIEEQAFSARLDFTDEVMDMLPLELQTRVTEGYYESYEVRKGLVAEVKAYIENREYVSETTWKIIEQEKQSSYDITAWAEDVRKQREIEKERKEFEDFLNSL